VKKLILFIRHSHPQIYKGALFIISIIFIVSIYPKQGKFKYEFYGLKNKPWHYDDLIAPFDFSIKKTKQELDAEKKDLLKNVKPYFIVDSSLYDSKKRFFENEFNQKWNNKNTSLKDETYKIGINIIDSLYTHGIIQSIPDIEGKADDFVIYILHDNIAEEHELGYFYTIPSAFEYVKNKIKENEKNIENNFLLPIIENCIEINISYNENTTRKVMAQALADISTGHNIILQGQRIVSKGEIINNSTYQILESLKQEYEQQSGGNKTYWFILIGQIIVVSICLSVMFGFLGSFRKEIFSDNTKTTFILLMIMIEVAMAYIPLSYSSINVQALPFCILPVIIRAFYDTRVALFAHLVAILLVSFMVPSPFEFAFVQVIGGMVAIMSIANMRKRSQIFVSAFLIFLSYSISFTGLSILKEGLFENLKTTDYLWFVLSSLLTIFSYPLIFIFEKLFGFTSDVSLLELSDTNSKLLRELSTKAPGTFQHSLQVANLAEEAIYTIGGNALLVRAGALYHDIGKMEMPIYFTENQSNGINPHEELPFEESASIIISHVIRGIEIAKKHKLPEQIIDFIRTHHGTSVTGYFYRKFQKEYPDSVIDEKKFHYPGPIPFSRETAVLMMADSVEAASHILKVHDSETKNN